MAWALDKKSNSYPAQFGALDGVPRQGEIICGHNPYLRARLVDDFSVEIEAEGNEKPTWKERPRPDVSWIRNKLNAGGAA
jgi:hypothetical protein